MSPGRSFAGGPSSPARVATAWINSSVLPLHSHCAQRQVIFPTICWRSAGHGRLVHVAHGVREVEDGCVMREVLAGAVLQLLFGPSARNALRAAAWKPRAMGGRDQSIAEYFLNLAASRSRCVQATFGDRSRSIVGASGVGSSAGDGLAENPLISRRQIAHSPRVDERLWQLRAWIGNMLYARHAQQTAHERLAPVAGRAIVTRRVPPGVRESESVRHPSPHTPLGELGLSGCYAAWATATLDSAQLVWPAATARSCPTRFVQRCTRSREIDGFRQGFQILRGLNERR